MLTESQIQRYSRQILLTGVGGRGQEALLSQRFVLRGQGAGLETAAAYLSAAGSPLEVDSARHLAQEEVGFLFERAGVGRPQSAALANALRGRGGDSSTAASGRPAEAQDGSLAPGELGEVPASFVGAGPRVALGRWASNVVEEGVAWAAPQACAACFDLVVARLCGGIEGAGSVRAGSVAALVAQRLVLGMEQGVGLLRLSPRGPLREEAAPCPRCR